MSLKTIIFFKRKIVLIVLIFCMLALGGIIFTFIRSVKLDKDHLFLLESAKNVEIAVSHSRIKLYDQFFTNEAFSSADINEELSRAYNILTSLKSNNGDKPRRVNKRYIRTFGDILNKSDQHIRRLKDFISKHEQNGSTEVNPAIIAEYNAFQETFLQFEAKLHDHISRQKLSLPWTDFHFDHINVYIPDYLPPCINTFDKHLPGVGSAKHR